MLAAARSHIASGAPFLSAPDVSVYEDLVENVASAIARFRTMNPADQARVLQRQADPFEALLVDYVRAAADAVVSLVPMMKGVQIDAIEDDLTAFIQHLLAARIQFLGWSVGDQSKGGFSASGNPGERDLLITWGSSVLAIIEAVICAKPLTQDAMKADLESHFQKLLGYGNPRVFFHLTYAYIEDKAGLMRSLETSADMASPPGFTYLGREPIPHDDSRPPGFVARYSADFGEVKVVFLVLNLGQQRQLQAAKTAAATKARKASEKAEKHRVTHRPTAEKRRSQRRNRARHRPPSTNNNSTDLHPKTDVPNVAIEPRHRRCAGNQDRAGKLVWLDSASRTNGRYRKQLPRSWMTYMDASSPLPVST